MLFWKIAKNHFKRQFLAIFSLAAIFAQAPQAGVITDVTGVKVSVPDHPQRIVTLAPSLGELAADLLGEDLGRIVGVSEYSDYPPALTKIASIGSYAGFNLEKVVSLKPDLVLATMDGNPKDQVLHLREQGLAVVVVGSQTFSQVQDSILLVAQAMGFLERGKKMVSHLKLGLDHLRKKAQPQVKRTVLLQIGDEPLVVVGHDSFLNEAVEIVRARNVYHDVKSHYPRPSLEDAIHRNPDVIVVLALGHELKPFYLMAQNWMKFPQIAAVKSHRVHVVQGDSILRPTLRLLEGLSILEKAIYEGS